MTSKFGDPKSIIKYSPDERKRVKARLTQLLKETKDFSRIAEIMNYEGYRRPNGSLINYQFVYLKSRVILKPNGKNSPPIKEVYKVQPNVQPKEQPSGIGYKQIETLVKYIKDNSALGAAIREMIGNEAGVS